MALVFVASNVTVALFVVRVAFGLFLFACGATAEHSNSLRFYSLLRVVRSHPGTSPVSVDVPDTCFLFDHDILAVPQNPSLEASILQYGVEYLHLANVAHTHTILLPL